MDICHACIGMLVLGLLLAVCQADAEPLDIPPGGSPMLPADALSVMRPNIRNEALGSAEVIEVDGLPFTRAMRITTLQKPKYAWWVQLTGRAEGGIQEADVCLFSFWVRGPHSEDETGDAVVRAYVQRRAVPHEKIGLAPTTANAEWRQVLVPFRASTTLPAGQVGVTFHLGQIPQTVEIGGIQLLNYGPSRDIQSLPGSQSTYRGRALDAPWRAAAAERIERIRKADLTIKVVNAEGHPLPGVEVHVKMTRHAFQFGVAVTAHLLTLKDADGDQYRAHVERLYNKVVFENDLKWGPWNVAKAKDKRWSKFRMAYTDEAFAWLNERDIEVRGHYITWAPIKPQEIERYGPDPDTFRRSLFAHMESKVPQVGERVGEWDVVNHIVGWGETLSTFLGGDQIYLDIIRRSRELAPHAELWVNEGAVLPRGDRRQSYERMVQYLVENDASPDGIGFMGHFGTTSLTPPETLYGVLDRFAALIPNLQLTELDVQVGDDEQLQADYLRDVMTVAFSHPAMQAIVMWGFWEGRHWKPDASLYREDWTIKPAGAIWEDLVFRQWWTDEHGTVDTNGTFRTRGFLGDYEVTISVDGEQQTIPIELGKEGNEVRIEWPE